MKLTTTTLLSLDGVMQGVGAPDQDRSNGFERGGWGTPYFDDETEGLIGQIYRRADAFLLGRQTYDIFARSWGAMPDPGRQPDLGGLDHAEQVRRVDHPHRPTVGKHHRRLR